MRGTILIRDEFRYLMDLVAEASHLKDYQQVQVDAIIMGVYNEMVHGNERIEEILKGG